jgi:hypothetical protein
MKPKMTVYQNGGKTPVATEPKKMMKTKSPLRMTKTKSPIMRMNKTKEPMPKPEKEVKLYQNGWQDANRSGPEEEEAVCS